jgi:hypothetical protein
MGCGSSASWKELHVASSYQSPRDVTLTVIASPAGGDVAALEMALVDAFGRHDIHATPLDGADARPTLRVMIEKWAPGSSVARRFVGNLAEGEIVVDVTAVGKNGEPAIQGKVVSWVNGTWIWAGDVDDSLHEIAELVTDTVVTGSRWPKQAPPPPHTGYP